MIKLRDVPKLIRYMAVAYRPMRGDRLSLLIWLIGLEEEVKLFRYPRAEQKPVEAGYARRMEMEINRIASLDEPARSLAAVELIRRIRDAKTVAQLAKKYIREDIRSVTDFRYPERENWWKKLAELAPMAAKAVTDGR